MASKTIILGLRIFRIGSEKSIHGRIQSLSLQIISLSGRGTYSALSASNVLESVE